MPDPPPSTEAGSVLYRLLFETNPQPALIFDRSTLAVVAANVAATALYGYTTKEFGGRTVGDLIPLEGLPRLLDELRSVSAADSEPRMRDLGLFRSRRKDRRAIDVEVAAGALRLDGRDAVMVLLTDVTERTLAETTLWESAEHLRRVVTSAPIVLWAVDRNGIFTLSEGHGLAALGLEAGEVVGRSAFEMYSDHAVVLDSIRRALAGESVSSTSTVGAVTFESFYSPLRGDDGEVHGVLGVSTDVTAHRRAEEALRQSEARFSKAFQASPAALTISTVADGRYLYVNDAYLRLLGYDRGELVGHRSTDFPFWPTPDARAQAIRQLGEVGSIRDVPLRVTTKAGEPRDLLVSLELVHLDGEACLLGMSQDITERLKAEREIREQRAFLRQVIDINPSMVFAKDRQHRFTLANQTTADAHGTTVEDLVGRTDDEFEFDRAEVEAFQRDDLEVMDTRQEKVILEETFTNTRGVRRWLQTVKRPIVGPDGVANQVLGVAMDITARKEAEEALRDAAEMSREIVSGAADGIFVCDLELRYRVWNRAMQEMTGVAERDALGRGVQDVFPEIHGEGFVQLLGRALGGEIVDSADVRFESAADRRARWLSRKYRPLRNAKGTIVGVVGVVRDVSDRRRG
jgi:PAS domain S-box-containing protein